MKEINLEEIINSIANFNTDEDGNTIYYLWEVKKAMKQACSKVLDLATKNATGNIDNIPGPGDIKRVYINKNSILQIKNWIE
jgi:hypothetical protein